jgi:hypothetical protein
MGEEHSKFLKIMSQRAKAIQGMLDLWMKSNFKVLIQTLKKYSLSYAAPTSTWSRMCWRRS